MLYKRAINTLVNNRAFLYSNSMIIFQVTKTRKWEKKNLRTLSIEWYAPLLSSTLFVSKTKFNIQLNITKKRNNLNNLQARSSLFLINLRLH